MDLESHSNIVVISKVQYIQPFLSEAHHLIAGDFICYTYKYINLLCRDGVTILFEEHLCKH